MRRSWETFPARLYEARLEKGGLHKGAQLKCVPKEEEGRMQWDAVPAELSLLSRLRETGSGSVAKSKRRRDDTELGEGNVLSLHLRCSGHERGI